MPLPQPLHTLLLARANFNKTRQQWLGHKNQVQNINKKIADASITLLEAQQQPAMTINGPEQSFLIDQTKAAIHTLTIELTNEQQQLSACFAALTKARITLSKAGASFSKAMPRKPLSALSQSPRLRAVLYPVYYPDPMPSPFYLDNNNYPIANGTCYLYDDILPPAPTLERSYTSTSPNSSTTQPLHAQGAPAITLHALDDLSKTMLSNLPPAPT